MATPIKPTPVLTGKDAKEFIKKVEDNDNYKPSQEDKDDYKKAMDIYNQVMKNNPDLR